MALIRLHQRLGVLCVFLFLLAALPAPIGQTKATRVSEPPAQGFPDAGEPPTPGWSGPVFHLSQKYPQQMPAAEKYPWKQFDFSDEKQWRSYLDAVLKYCLEGNVDVDWDLNQNKVRHWYHGPWMHWGANGREFIHGLTDERVSLPGELGPDQKSSFQNWAVGMYNAPGGWIIGRVWANPNQPNPAAISNFPDGTVSIKLLFTQATTEEVPYLAGSKEWDAYIYDKVEMPTNPSGSRSVQKLRLLQVDIAVRDDRNDKNTGWVFATYIYSSASPGQTVYDKLVPVGIMWGNDPQARTQTDKITQTLVNTSSVLPKQHLGWNGRLNGPVDNPMSSCLSCHSTAQWQVLAPLVPPRTATPGTDEWMEWFRNVRAGEPFSVGAHTLDYSLQLAFGIQNFHAWKQIAQDRGGSVNRMGIMRLTTPSSERSHAKLKPPTYKITRAPDQER